jgi:hypothetical protein
MWSATAFGLNAALAAVDDDGDTLNALAWFVFVAAGALSASGAAERSPAPFSYIPVVVPAPPQPLPE